MAQKQHQRQGESLWKAMPRVNSEIFSLTYGALVMQLIKDYEEVDAVNVQLEKMGYNIGLRLVDEFLSKANITSCSNFRETADVIAKIAFKMFLGVTVEVGNWNTENTAFSLLISNAADGGSNPITDFVEIPPQYADLVYGNLYCGVIRAALEMVQLAVTCHFVRDVLRGDDITEIRIELTGTIATVMSDEYKEN